MPVVCKVVSLDGDGGGGSVSFGCSARGMVWCVCGMMRSFCGFVWCVCGSVSFVCGVMWCVCESV